MINGSVVAEEGTPSEMRVEIFAQQVIEAVKVIESEVPQELFGKKADFTYTLILPTDVERVMNGNSAFGPTPEEDKIEITVACEAPIPTGELAPQSVPIPRKTRRQLLDVNDWICTGKRLTSVHEQVVEEVARQRPDLRHTACVQRPYGVEITVGSLEFETRSKDQSPASMRTWFPRIPRVRYSVLYFSGRYVKHTRNLSQTPWFLPNGNRIGLDSLEEILMRPLLELCFSSRGESQTRYTRRRCLTERTTTHMKWRQRRQCNAEHPVDACNRMLDENPADSSEIATFASSGREDIDVRMLGEGRPFVIQIFGAARVPTQEELLNVKKSLDDLDVQLTDLRHADQTCMKELQEGEEQKKKSYRCVVWSKRALQPDDVHFVRLNQCTSEHPIVIEQWTPVRVLHRRSLLKRERVIHHVHLTWINWHWILVDLTTSAGTYVKEFIGGDHGRTTPSLGDLLHSCCDIIQLDVMGIECGGGEALPEQ